MGDSNEVKIAVKEGRLSDALAAAKEAVRSSPSSHPLRIALFELFSIEGDWDRAAAQLDTLKNLGQKDFADIFVKVLAGERAREAFFLDGAATPECFGESHPSWVADLIEAGRLLAKDDAGPSAEHRDRAFQAAPPSSGTINETAFEIIGDADARFGPVLEFIFDGSYYWIPFAEIKSLESEAPDNLRDLVWKPAQLSLTTSEMPRKGYIPVRYPGTAVADADAELKLARRTDWTGGGETPEQGVGQRLLATDVEDYPLLDITSIVVEQATG